MLSLIKEKLKTYIGKEIESPQDICAGVLIPLFEINEEPFVLLTKRTEMVNQHKGEVSFPGGMCEEEDENTLTTALRECCEEIGLDKKDVEVVGRLDDMITLTGFVITPYVGIIPYPYKFRTNPREVAYIIHLPLKHLIEVKPSMEEHMRGGKTELVPSFCYNGERIWGATCRILLKLRKIIEDEKVQS
jgi:8-oxo-dGTP pyrophosphatase MutT (NUDIX family)